MFSQYVNINKFDLHQKKKLINWTNELNNFFSSQMFFAIQAKTY